jgi:hypothetical protein
MLKTFQTDWYEWAEALRDTAGVLSFCCATSEHKPQGSEFSLFFNPMFSAHYSIPDRNLMQKASTDRANSPY